MKLCTFVNRIGAAAVGVVDTEKQTVLALQDAYSELYGQAAPMFRDMLSMIRQGVRAIDQARELAQRFDDDRMFLSRLADVTLLAPVPVPEQIRDFSTFDLHMKQAGAAIGRIRAKRTGTNPALVPPPADLPLPPVYFQQPVYYKANRFNVVGTEHDVRWPAHSNLIDFEAEIGIFIGKAGRDIRSGDANDHIFGFTIFNDFSARDQQELEMEAPFGPAKGKDFDTGNAIGPWIVTPDEIPDPYDLAVTIRVNGEVWTSSSTVGMRHHFGRIIEHVSRDETLHPGEFLGSGTVGNGCGLELDRWLTDGDIVEVEVEKIGVLRNRVTRIGRVAT
nr:fumarylacetoacetate hydrolase family protein [Burkholderia ambifaria]